MDQIGFNFDGGGPRAVPLSITTKRATWDERFANYRRVIGKSPHLHRNEDDGWIEGFWLFNDYARHSDYHGAYMRNLLKRYAALFFDHGRILHVCSGSLAANNPWLPGDTLDIRADLNPIYCVDAQTCEGVPLEQYRSVFVDVPYSEADAKIYGPPMLKRSRVLGALAKGLNPGALIVWLDEKTPTYRREWPLKWEGVWGISTSGGHRTRTVFVYSKLENS